MPWSSLNDCEHFYRRDFLTLGAAGFRDMVWALINTREFILNH